MASEIGSRNNIVISDMFAGGTVGNDPVRPEQNADIAGHRIEAHDGEAPPSAMKRAMNAVKNFFVTLFTNPSALFTTSRGAQEGGNNNPIIDVNDDPVAPPQPNIFNIQEARLRVQQEADRMPLSVGPVVTPSDGTFVQPHNTDPNLGDAIDDLKMAMDLGLYDGSDRGSVTSQNDPFPGGAINNPPNDPFPEFDNNQNQNVGETNVGDIDLESETESISPLLVYDEFDSEAFDAGSLADFRPPSFAAESNIPEMFGAYLNGLEDETITMILASPSLVQGLETLAADGWTIKIKATTNPMEHGVALIDDGNNKVIDIIHDPDNEMPQLLSGLTGALAEIEVLDSGTQLAGNALNRQIEATTIFTNMVTRMEVLANEGEDLAMNNPSFVLFDFIFREDVNVMPVDAQTKANVIAEFVYYLGRIEAAGLNTALFEAQQARPEPRDEDGL